MHSTREQFSIGYNNTTNIVAVKNRLPCSGLVYHTISTKPGDSGRPLFVPGKNEVAGIHHTGQGNGKTNIGTYLVPFYRHIFNHATITKESDLGYEHVYVPNYEEDDERFIELMSKFEKDDDYEDQYYDYEEYEDDYYDEVQAEADRFMESVDRELDRQDQQDHYNRDLIRQAVHNANERQRFYGVADLNYDSSATPNSNAVFDLPPLVDIRPSFEVTPAERVINYYLVNFGRSYRILNFANFTRLVQAARNPQEMDELTDTIHEIIDEHNDKLRQEMDNEKFAKESSWLS